MAWLREVHGGDPPPEALLGVSMDGKALRGTRTIDEMALMLISAFDQESACVLLQHAVPAETNEQKAALELLKQMVLTGRVITADAAHCYPETCEQIVESGGHYVLTAKDNQPTLVSTISSEFAALDTAFSPYQARQRQSERQSHTTYDKGHGRHEKRTIETTTALNVVLSRLGWSSVRQVFRITRQRTTRDRETGERKTTTEVVYGITDLTREQADAAQLLEYNRAHWGIENKTHYTRDVTFGEDAHQAKSGFGPQLMAAARNTATAICRLHGFVNIAEARRNFAWNPQRLFSMLGFVKN
jgi:predicted transposase YbfD/YdcC